MAKRLVHSASVDSFSVRRAVEVDLDTCTVTLAIHGDEVLEAAHVVLPLQAIGWIGFPQKAVAVGV